jgi:hypothetical protein
LQQVVDAIPDDPLVQHDFYQTVGGVTSTLAELLPDRARRQWLERAKPYFERCTKAFGPATAREDPRFNDFSNYVDLLRKLGEWQEALYWINRAHQAAPKPGSPFPTEARAMIFAGMKHRIESLHAIQEYDEPQALAALDAKNAILRTVSPEPGRTRKARVQLLRGRAPGRYRRC